MKKMYLTAGAILVALLAPACTQTQQQQSVETPLQATPDAVAADASPEATEEAPADGEEEADSESEKPKEHVCTGLLSCKLGLCPNGQRRRAEMEAEQKASEEAEAAAVAQSEADTPEEEPSDITPSPEQMAAAKAAMEKKDDERPAKRPTRTVKAEPEPVVDEAPVVTANNTSGIPGRSGLRMGRFAPQEEAASRGDNTAPIPNAAERHGLRSPSLPSALPMNIEGKTNR